ncbi:hypothetical protein MTO96_019068 [Rhipicephalus appendiculatus]
MAPVVLVSAVLLAFAAIGGRAQTPGCWNEQMADKQRLQYGLMMVRQQIANMLTLEYIAGVSTQMGSPLGVKGSTNYGYLGATSFPNLPYATVQGGYSSGGIYGAAPTTTNFFPAPGYAGMQSTLSPPYPSWNSGYGPPQAHILPSPNAVYGSSGSPGYIPGYSSTLKLPASGNGPYGSGYGPTVKLPASGGTGYGYGPSYGNTWKMPASGNGPYGSGYGPTVKLPASGGTGYGYGPSYGNTWKLPASGNGPYGSGYGPTVKLPASGGPWLRIRV